MPGVANRDTVPASDQPYNHRHCLWGLKMNFHDPNRPVGTARQNNLAYGVAMLRASHQVFDVPPVFADPLALPVVGAGSAADLQARYPPHWFAETRAMRAFVAVRSRYAEDQLAKAIAQGVRQYVVLGAGLDTYGYRPGQSLSAVRVFEVDHPRAQPWKLQRLRAAEIEVPPTVKFVPLDFSKETLGDKLETAGFRIDEPAFFSFLGVAIYLEEAAVMATLRFVAALPAGSQIVFDYGIPAGQLIDDQRRERAQGMRLSALIGAPWRTFLDPAALVADLQKMGFAHTENLDPQEINNRYMQGRQDGLCVAPGGRRLIWAGR